ncbi:MAG TPA: ABC transporter permease [Acidimicrobiia bacterium]|nr:ABC transporter permease [Acidimicrobiia bacterium]
MTVITERDIATEPEVVQTKPDERRAVIIGVILMALAAVVLGVFAFGVPADAISTFNLSLPGDTIENLSFSIGARLFSGVAAVMIFALGIDRLRRQRLGFTNTALGIGLLLFVLAFLTWAAADSSFSMVGMLRSTVISSVVITLGALTGLTCERAGVINIGIEGQLLTAAFVAVVLSSAFGTWAGVAGALVIGALLGALLAWLSIRFLVDQIIAGVVINILALGLTSFLASRVLSEAQDLNAPARISSIRIPILADIPVIGPMFFDHTFFVYVTFILVFALHFALFRTRWGLRTRSVGEHPKAADTLGIDVLKVRYRNVIGAGLIAGFGGAFLALAQISRFEENMTGGIGFIGLAAMIFGRWMPFGALAAGLVFGFSGALAQKVAILGTGIPSEFMLMLPYVATVIVVAGLVGNARPPAADGQPYVKH